jgi:ankyrin repeat protein
VATVPLPEDPNLEQLKQQARDLKRAFDAGDADARAHVVEHLPTAAPADGGPLALTSAQLVIARHHRYSSWPKLKQFVDQVSELGRRPGDVGELADPADEFLRLACMTYADDGGEPRFRAARELLTAHPDITDASGWAAAATADVAALRVHLERDPDLASRRGGPFGWTPLFYLAYTRHDPNPPADAVLATARLLLDGDADPNDGYLFLGLPTPFTILTGCFGNGEHGSVNEPHNPNGLALARLVLEAGADPNDGQGLYNRMFSPDDTHLELLFEFGLGQGDGGPWQARLGEALETPTEMLQRQLAWAAIHAFDRRIDLLAEHGVDLDASIEVGVVGGGRTAIQLAALRGNTAIVDQLRELGAAPPRFTARGSLIAAAMAGDRAEVDRLQAAEPDALDAARQARPDLVVQAAAAGRPDAVQLLVDLGFDVNAMGRADIATPQRWQTGLHEAVGAQDLDMVRLLLSLGADPTMRDHRFDSTALGWARHFEADDIADVLGPLVPEDL